MTNTGRWNRIRQLILPAREPAAATDETRAQTLAKRLGYGSTARLLIVHADDLGLTRSVNTAFISGFAKGLINSGSAMVPCAEFFEVAAFAQTNPEADIGLHLTLTSEHAKYRWAPVAERTLVPSLIDPDGYFHQTWTSDQRIDLGEIGIELRAQIERAYAVGLHPTHLDSHQFRLQLQGKELFEVFLGLGREFKLPVLVTQGWLVRYPYLRAALDVHDVVLDGIRAINTEVTPDQWPAYYRRVLGELPPGVTEIVIHPGLDDEESRAFFEGRPAWGAAWRQRDFDFFTSDEFRNMIESLDIKLVDWRQISARLS